MGILTRPLYPMHIHAVQLFVPTDRLIMVCAALGLWGASNGMCYSALEALFADSVPTGRRSDIYVR